MTTTTTPVSPNAREIDRWNGHQGDLWVAEQARFDRMLEPVDQILLPAADLRSGERVLDVGCGAGTTTLAAAWEVAPAGSVVGIDGSQSLVAAARDWAAAWPVVDFVVGDAQVHRFDQPFDVVVSRNGLMLFEDPAAAFANLAANLRPGGRLAFATWAEGQANAWSAIPNAAIAAHVRLPSPPSNGPCAFSLCDPAHMRALLAGAGFRDVAIRRVDAEMWVASDVADAVEFFERSSGDLRAFVSDEVAARIIATLRVSLAQYARADGVWLPSASWVVTATLSPRALAPA